MKKMLITWLRLRSASGRTSYGGKACVGVMLDDGQLSYHVSRSSVIALPALCMI